MNHCCLRTPTSLYSDESRQEAFDCQRYDNHANERGTKYGTETEECLFFILSRRDEDAATLFQFKCGPGRYGLKEEENKKTYIA